MAAVTATKTARDLANCPPNILRPPDFIKLAKKYFANTAIKVSVIDSKKAKKMGMNALVSVSEGSDVDSALLELRYTPSKKKPIILVGKGVTFDSGGLSLKPPKSMPLMKGDMGGAAAVFGAMMGVKELKPKHPVIGLIPLAENMPSGTATRPGDVITAMNGTHIEILNTDAEGRLILADALSYATQLNPQSILSIATLTGACGVALGDLYGAVLSNTTDLIDHLKALGEKTGEKVWPLPLDEDYRAYLKSEIADIANVAEGKGGGTITAAKFLEQFVDNHQWAHLDIASVMHYKQSSGYLVKGMSGFGARLLLGAVSR